MQRDDALKALNITKSHPSTDEVHSAYRAAARRFHPDQHINADPIALEAIREKFERVKEARDVLLKELRESSQTSSQGSSQGSYHETQAPASPLFGRWRELPHIAHEVAECHRFLERRQFSSALIHSENASRELPDDYELFQLRAQVLSQLNREYTVEAEALEWTLRFPSLKRSYDHQLLLFQSLRAQSKNPRALQVISEMIEREGEVPTLLTLKAITLIEMKQAKRADLIIDRLKVLDPNNPLVQERAGVMLVGDQYIDKQGAAQDACLICVLLECIFDCL